MIIHENRWSWGRTATIVMFDGEGLVDLSFEDTNPNVCYLHGLSVIPTERRKGRASIIMQEAICYCKQCGIFRIDLCSIQEPWLMNFYHKLGFVDVKEEDGLMRMYKILQYGF